MGRSPLLGVGGVGVRKLQVHHPRTVLAVSSGELSSPVLLRCQEKSSKSRTLGDLYGSLSDVGARELLQPQPAEIPTQGRVSDEGHGIDEEVGDHQGPHPAGAVVEPGEDDTHDDVAEAG